MAVRCAAGAIWSIRLARRLAGRPVLLLIDPTTGTATLDRTRLGTGEGGGVPGSFRPGSRVDLRVLLDSSSIEVFVDGGRLVISARIYPDPADTAVSIGAVGGAARVDVTCHPMGKD